MNPTLDFYDNNAKELISRYDNADLKQLHNIFQKYIKSDNDVLDLGFGSGRDMKFLNSITPNVYGVDACDTFVDNMVNNGFKDKATKSILPEINIDKLKTNKFDVVVSIAVIMHLNLIEIDELIKNIKQILKNQGIVIISYSLERSSSDDRHFEPLTKSIITDVLKKYSFVEIESFENTDVLNRNIKWLTQIFHI